jgi:two-component system response regulator MprA
MVVSTDPHFISAHVRVLADDWTTVEPAAVSPAQLPALFDAAVKSPDVIVLDRRSIPEPARRMRNARRRFPTSAILVANARDDAECLSYLNEGADDACAAGSPAYEARLNALTRRARALNADMRVALGDLVVDREHRRLWCSGTELELAAREFDVFLCLFQCTPRAVDKESLSVFVWGEEARPRTNTVEVYVGYLRKRLSPSRGVVIETIRGVGYALVARTAQ